MVTRSPAETMAPGVRRAPLVPTLKTRGCVYPRQKQRQEQDENFAPRVARAIIAEFLGKFNKTVVPNK